MSEFFVDHNHMMLPQLFFVQFGFLLSLKFLICLKCFYLDVKKYLNRNISQATRKILKYFIQRSDSMLLCFQTLPLNHLLPWLAWSSTSLSR